MKCVIFQSEANLHQAHIRFFILKIRMIYSTIIIVVSFDSLINHSIFSRDIFPLTLHTRTFCGTVLSLWPLNESRVSYLTPYREPCEVVNTWYTTTPLCNKTNGSVDGNNDIGHWSVRFVTFFFLHHTLYAGCPRLSSDMLLIANSR